MLWVLATLSDGRCIYRESKPNAIFSAFNGHESVKPLFPGFFFFIHLLAIHRANVDLTGISLCATGSVWFSHLCTLAEKWTIGTETYLFQGPFFRLTCQQSSLSSHFYCFLVNYFQGRILHSKFMCSTPGSWPWTKWPPCLSITDSTKNKRKWCC